MPFVCRFTYARWLCLGCACALLLVSGCAAPPSVPDPGKPHHRAHGFVNAYPSPHGDRRASFWRWQWERLRANLPPDRPERVPRVAVDLARLQNPGAAATVTWLGHSTALWQVAGLNILTDPHFGLRASPLPFAGPRRLTEVPVPLAQLPRIDVVLISHNHYDHLDRDTVLALARQAGGPPLFLVPLGVDEWMRAQGVESVRAMDWWDQHVLTGRHGELRVHFVPAHHWSARTLWDRQKTLWGGFVVEMRTNPGATPVRLYHAGDTGYAPDFAEIGQRFGSMDLAMIPVGCYLPRWFMKYQHVNEEEAVRIHRDVKSRFSIGVHWGVFRLCDDPIDAPLEGLPAALARLQVPASEFILPALGQTVVVPGSGP